MKQFYLLIFSFSLLTASEKSTSFTRFSDLTSDQKKRVNERLKRFEDRKELKKFERFSHSDKISKKEYNQLRRSLLQQDRKHVKKKRSPNGRLDREAVKSNNSSKIKTMDTNLYGRWESEGDEEGVFITLNSAVTIPDLEQFIGLEEGIGEMVLISTLDGNVIHDPNLKYMYASDYTFGGAIHLTNYSWFEEIPEGSQVFNLLFFYDTGFGDFEDFIEYLKKVDLRYPTAGFLEIYTWVDWESDEDDNWFYIPFGHGQAPEGSVKFGGGLVALIFDGAGTVAISDPFDPTVPEEDSYSVSDEGILMTSEGPSGMVNSDGSVVAFLMQEEGTDQGLVALGFKTPETKPNLASLQDTYYGTRITRDSQSFLGTTYEYPNVDIFAVSFDGLGGYAVEPLSGDDAESFNGTYTIGENGMILFDSGPIGFISADSSYGVWATPETEEDEDNEAVGFIVKAGVEKSAASLEGVFSFTQFEGGLELGTEVSIHFGIYSGEVEFDGAGTYTVSDGEESETGTYDVSATGVLTVDDEEFGFVGPGDDVILFANLEEYSGGAGVAVKKSTGMTDASLAGYYGVAFLEVYSDAPEMASIEDHVTVDFFGVTDTSEVNVTVVDEYYDDDGELWIDLRFPAPSGITISNLVFKGYDFNEDWLTFVVGGELSIENMTIAAGVPYPLPSLWDWDGEDDDGDFFVEFESNNLGRGIDTWSYTNDDDGTTEEWSDTTNFLWSTNNDTLNLLISSWEWDEETEEEFETYEKVELEYFFSGPMLSLSDQSEVCDWWEDGWDSWADCIEYEYPILDLAMSFAGNAFEDAYQTWEEDFTYRGEVPTKPTRASSLPMVGSMPNIFMQDMEISGNRLYSGGDVNFDGTMERYLRILDIADPKNPKELAFQKPTDANTSYLFDMVMKGNVLITNDDYGPNFYNVEGDKITAGVGSYHLDFDGSDDYVDIGAISTNFTTADFSIQAWVKTDRSIAQGILLKSDGDGTWDESDFHLYMTSGGYVNWVGWGRDYISGNKSINDGKWHHVVVVWDYSGSGTTGTGKMYVDGTDATGSSSYNANGNDLNSNKLYFGKDNNSETDNYFDGSLKEISIWSQALTANEVSTLYNAGSGKTATTVQTAKVVGYWELDEGSGSTVTDESGNSNNGVISGAAWARNAGGGIAATKCCFGDVMTLHGNNLYIPTKGDMGNGFRIIDVTVPTLPSITKDVELGDLDDDDEWAPWFSDIHANDSYVYIIDWGGGEGTDDCEDANVLRIHSAASPYSQVATFNIGYADKMEIAGSFLYTTSCGEFRIYDISDVSNITKVATLDPWELSSGHNEYFHSFDGEIEKVGNYVYIATGGYDDWWDKGIDIIDVTHHTAPVHVGIIPGTKRNEEAGGGLDYHVRSVEVSGGYVYVPQQSRGSEVDDTVGKGSAKGSLSIYQNDFSPQPFRLMFPPDGMDVEITEENAWEESMTFAWHASEDLEGNAISYTVFFDEGLDPLYYHILDACEDAENTCTIPLHRMKDYLHIEGLSSVSGVWDVLATDGVSNTSSSNGPYKLTIDASSVSTVDENNLPISFALHSNFPNPFNPTTSIKYNLPEDASVSLMIYDITGREIRHLVNETQNAGFKAIMWDGTNNYGHQVGTGMYLYQIKAGSFVQTRKMLLMK